MENHSDPAFRIVIDHVIFFEGEQKYSIFRLIDGVLRSFARLFLFRSVPLCDKSQ
jgi:hypothetical protein